MVGHSHNPSIWEAEIGRSVWDYKVIPYLEQQTQTRKRKRKTTSGFLVAEPKARFTYLTWEPLGQEALEDKNTLDARRNWRGRKLTQGVGHRGAGYNGWPTLSPPAWGHLPPFCRSTGLPVLPALRLSLTWQQNAQVQVQRPVSDRCSGGWVTTPWGLSSRMLEGQQCRGSRGQGKLPPGQDSDTQHSSPSKNNFFF